MESFEQLMAEAEGRAGEPAPPVKGLAGALRASRDGGPHRHHEDDADWEGRRGFGRFARGRGRGWGARREDDEEAMDAEEPGTICLRRPMGAYDVWKPEEWKSPDAGSILVAFEAKARDNIVVALSPEARDMGHEPMYEIVIGGWHDSKSVIRRQAQGPDRALKAERRLCSAISFRKYWACLDNGMVSVGVGEVPGRRVLLAWKDPEPIPAQYVSFTSWDNVARYRNVNVGSCSGVAMDEVNVESYVPSFLAKIDEERQKRKQRAEKFGEAYVEPPMEKLAEHALSSEERHKMQYSGAAEGFVTGFDPFTEEEKKKAEERAKRFGIDPAKEASMPGDGPDRSKREERARRFAIPVIEDQKMTEGIVRDLSNLRVPRRDPDAEELPREEAIHIYGSFDSIYTDDVLSWVSDFGASHLEWLHDCAANVVFAEAVTAKRALLGLAKEIPEVEPHGDVVRELRKLGYFCAPFPLDPQGGHFRYFLIRQAAVADVKADKKSGYRTTIGYSKRGGGHRRYRARRRDPASFSSPAHDEARERVKRDIEREENEKTERTLKKRGRSDSDSSGDGRSDRRMRLGDD